MKGMGILLGSLLCCSTLAQPKIWVTAYYAGWMQGNQWSYHLRAQDIDYGALTHIIHFSLGPKEDGTVDDKGNSVTAENAAALISKAHAAGVKVLISIGGWNSEAGFRGATSPRNRKAFIGNILTLVRTRGYDGVDIDWEPVSQDCWGQYADFVAELRSSMTATHSPMLLTAATAGEPGLLGRVHQYFDQINIMAYDMSGAWPGWVTWHNAPVYNGKAAFNSGTKLPCADDRVNLYIAAGVPREKIGIGIDFYGYVWRGGTGTLTGGATGPRQEWRDAPQVKDNVPYFEIMDSLYQPQFYRWDEPAQAAYLSIDRPGSNADVFVSYDDEHSCEQKVKYAVEKKIGGVMIWELGAGWRQNVTPSDALLRSVKSAVAKVRR